MDVKPQKPNGKSIMLLHGKNFNGAYWGETIDALTAKGYRVIVPDQVGFGKSTKPMHFQYSFQQLAINTKQVLDSLHLDKVTVLGHSMGGKTAMLLACENEELVQKLVVVDIAPKYYAPHHQQILEGLTALDEAHLTSRGDAEDFLEKHISEKGVRLFLLKNLYWKTKCF